MIKYYLFLLAVLTALEAPKLWANEVIPNALKGEQAELKLRTFYQLGEFNGLLEFSGADGLAQQRPKHVRIGGKYRVLRFWKLGAYYTRNYGQRHNDDWDNRGAGWQWHTPHTRGENHYTLESTLRALIANNWVPEWRLQYVLNDYNDQQTLKSRLGLTYIMEDRGLPWFNLFWQYELYFPLNFSESTVYERWAYAGMLYHLNERYKPGLYLARKTATWTDNQRIFARTGQSYKITDEAWVLGLFLDIYF